MTAQPLRGDPGRMDPMDDEELYTAGQIAPRGRYRRIDRLDDRVVTLEREDRLPASLDGQVALYRRLPAELAGWRLVPAAPAWVDKRIPEAVEAGPPHPARAAQSYLSASIGSSFEAERAG